MDRQSPNRASAYVRLQCYQLYYKIAESIAVQIIFLDHYVWNLSMDSIKHNLYM